MKIRRLLIGVVLSSTLFFLSCGGDENTPPSANNVSVQVPEDTAIGTVIANITASDAEGDVLSYTIISGNDANTFELNDEGALRTLVSLDFETTDSYLLSVAVSDGDNSVNITVSIEIIDVDESPGNSGVEVMIDGINYTLVDGLIDDFGGDGTHYNYDFFLVNDEIKMEDGDLVPGEETTIFVYAELFSAGNSSFNPGTFEYLDVFSTPRNDQSYFNYFAIATYDDPSDVVNEQDPAKWFIAVGGSVTVTQNTGLNYTIAYNLDVAEADYDTDEVIVGGSEFTLEFTYTGDFEFIPLDDAARKTGVKNLDKGIF